MLIEQNSKLFIYPASRDLGFAPNPFHGICTLATCKPNIRKRAKVNDWVIGLAGASIKGLKHKCIFIMKITEKVTFQEYWEDPRFELKKPVRNGSKVQVLGDNIYHRNRSGKWVQEDSHHSNVDGSMHLGNLQRDTGRTEDVLISECFIYYGSKALQIDLDRLDYGRIRDYKVVDLNDNIYAKDLIHKIFSNKDYVNFVLGDPCHFNLFESRVDQDSGRYS
ncbi:hypothetical protein [Pseudoalteromonas ardens]|uniref:Nmad2 family putative nucleotide modification protein n=1 Tax=Pseudoalteromonas ardens TaxID=3048490 RepID=UPI0024C47155|nr:hypothetical protein [Pseudoalteromonas sp. R96]MDK1313823.1 hypothetical protein [Pseudoalteromonas sp. R96]